MSRTRKDRPEWVRSNDPSEERSISHRHWGFNRPVYRTRPVLDEKGNQLYRDVIRREFEPIFAYRLDETGDLYLATKGPDEEFGYRGRYIEKVVREAVYETLYLGNTPENCVVGIRTPRPIYSGGEPQITTTCHFYIDRYYRNRPMQPEKRNYHAGMRRGENLALHAAARLFNAGEDISDYDDERINTRVRRHKGWWD